MKESIYTIPVSEVFELKTGCPVCALHSALEERWVGYITGAAMMEPDVRVKTNEEGVCGRHLELMLEQRNRLSVALVLQTRLQHVLEHLGSRPVFGKSKSAGLEESCFVCTRINSELVRLCGNIATIWAREPDFRALYAGQEHICLPHHGLLIKAAGSLRTKDRTLFIAETDALVRRGLELAKERIDAYCRLFDHRNAGETAPPEVSGAIKYAGELLCGLK